MVQGTIFKDRNRLLPNFPIEKFWRTLPHREEQVGALQTFYHDILEKRGESFLRVCQVIGPSGTGKTCTLRFFGDTFARAAQERGLNLFHIYINLKLEGGRRVVLYRNLLNKIEPTLVSTSFSAEEMLGNLVHYLQETKKRVLLTIDEIDYYVKHFNDEGVVYDLTRLNELTPQRPCGIVGATFLARDTRFHELLDRAELSTLGRLYFEFKPYDSLEVLDILEKRAKEALNEGTCAIDVLEFIADLTSSPSINGDLRYALDLLLYSGQLAENQGSDSILPEHVRRVHGETYHAITTEDILSLPVQEKLVLMGVVRALKSKKLPYASLREIRSMVGLVCEEYHFKVLDEVEEYVQDLCDRNIIDIKSLTQIGISGVPVEDLNKFLNNLIERIRSGMDGR